MKIRLVSFGEIDVKGQRYDHNVMTKQGEGAQARQEGVQSVPRSVRSRPAVGGRSTFPVVARSSASARELAADCP